MDGKGNNNDENNVNDSNLEIQSSIVSSANESKTPTKESITQVRLDLRSQTIHELFREYKAQPKPTPKRKEPNNEEFVWPFFHIRKLFECAHVNLHMDVIDGNVETVQATMKRIHYRYPHKINALDKQGRTALSLAIKINEEDIFEILLSSKFINVNLSDTDEMEMAPLHHASHVGSISITQALIQKGSVIDSIDKHGRTPLMIACARGKKMLFWHCVHFITHIVVVVVVIFPTTLNRFSFLETDSFYEAFGH